MKRYNDVLTETLTSDWKGIRFDVITDPESNARYLVPNDEGDFVTLRVEFNFETVMVDQKNWVESPSYRLLIVIKPVIGGDELKVATDMETLELML